MKRIVFLLISTVAMISFFGCTSKKSLDEVQKRGDLYYLKNSDNLFSGLLYADYAKDTGWFKKEIKKGMMDGKVQLWYRKGQKKYEVDYKENKPNGTALGWYENGVQWFKGSVINGNLDGAFEIRNEDNVIVIQSNYANGLLNGKWNEFYSNTKMKVEGSYKDDLQIGKWTFYHDDGSKFLEGEYKDGRKVGKWQVFDKNCSTGCEISFINDYPVVDSWTIYSDILKVQDKTVDNCKIGYLYEIMNKGLNIIVSNLLPLKNDPIAIKADFFAFNPDSLKCSIATEGLYFNDKPLMAGDWKKAFSFDYLILNISEQQKLSDLLKPIIKEERRDYPYKCNYQGTVSLIGQFQDGAPTAMIFKKPIVYSYSGTDNKVLVNESSLPKNGSLKDEIISNLDKLSLQKAILEIPADKVESITNPDESESLEQVKDCNDFIVKFGAFVDKYADIVIKYQQNKNNVELYTEIVNLYVQAQKWMKKGDECAKDPAFAAKVSEINMKLIQKMQEAQNMPK